jgi:hypothetical protein
MPLEAPVIRTVLPLRSPTFSKLNNYAHFITQGYVYFEDVGVAKEFYTNVF